MEAKQNTLLQTFIDSYLQTAQWVLEDEPSRGFTKEAKQRAKQDCERFISLVEAEFTPEEAQAIISYEGIDVGRLAGHDFYLTRNRHGAGFWDNPIYDELADNGCQRLTFISQSFGGSDAYLDRGYIKFG